MVARPARPRLSWGCRLPSGHRAATRGARFGFEPSRWSPSLASRRELPSWNRTPLQSSSGSGTARHRRLTPAGRAASPGIRCPFDACAPGAPCCRGLTTAGGEGRHTLAGAALGLAGPSAVSAGLELRGLNTGPRASLGFHPSEVSPPEKPCRVTAALAPLRVRRRPVSGAAVVAPRSVSTTRLVLAVSSVHAWPDSRLG